MTQPYLWAYLIQAISDSNLEISLSSIFATAWSPVGGIRSTPFSLDLLMVKEAWIGIGPTIAAATGRRAYQSINDFVRI